MPTARRSTLAAACLAVALVLALAAPAPAAAQYFGRNKVQYDDFDFRILTTPHFDIYYYPAELKAATEAGRMAERWYGRLSRLLNHELSSALGFAIVELNLVRPLDRNGRGWMFAFNLRPGF